jgi:hypothetical protein
MFIAPFSRGGSGAAPLKWVILDADYAFETNRTGFWTPAKRRFTLFASTHVNHWRTTCKPLY